MMETTEGIDTGISGFPGRLLVTHHTPMMASTIDIRKTQIDFPPLWIKYN
jgi:hypothetical protein